MAAEVLYRFDKMKKIVQGIVFVCFVLIPFAAALVIFGNSDREQLLEYREICRSFYAEIESENKIEQVMPWRDESGTYYLVLPSYAPQNGTVFLKENNSYGLKVRVDGRKTDEYPAQHADELTGTHVIEWEDEQGRIKEHAELEILCAKELPTVFVTTSSGNLDIIHASKDNREKGLVSVYTSQGKCDYTGPLNYMKGRGNVTWEQAKKPYNLSLQQKESLLGMKATAEWTLLAGAMDPSYIRNKLAFDMAKGLGLQDTSDAAFVDLYINGEYTGLYLLAERVDLTQETKGEEYLLEIEMQERLAGEDYGFLTEAGQAVVVKRKNNLSEEKISRLKAHIQRIEDAVYQEEWETVWELMDLESCVTIYLIEEILQNHDAYISSQYMRLYEQNGSYSKLYSGPVWDFDSSLNPKDGMYAATLTAGQSREGYPKFWITKMVQNEAFRTEAAKQYLEMKARYLDSGIWESLASNQNRIGGSVELDCLRWRHQSAANWQEEIQKMTDYLTERLQFLDAFWSGEETFHKVHLYMGSDIFSSLDYDIKDGETCKDFPRELKKTGYTFAGWYLAGTDTIFTTETPVYENLSVEARWEKNPQGGLLEKVRESDFLQMRYLLFACMILGTIIVLVFDRKRHRE